MCPILLCAVFPRSARKNRTQRKEEVPLQGHKKDGRSLSTVYRHSQKSVAATPRPAAAEAGQRVASASQPEFQLGLPE
jgi:hypothetical protein